MKTKKQKQTAVARDIKSAAQAAEKHADIAEAAAETARLYAAAGREHATVAESAATRADDNLADTSLYSDKAREAATLSQVYAKNADNHAYLAASAAEDAATYARTARICLLLTVIFNAIFAFIFYALR